jgi:hypothetical protein
VPKLDAWPRLGVSLSELGSLSVFVDHVSEELMMLDWSVEQGHRGGAVGWWVLLRLVG